MRSGPSDAAGHERLSRLPAGWTALRLKQVARMDYGGALPRDRRVPGAVPVYGSGGRDGWHDQSNTDGPAIVLGRKGSFGRVHYSEVACFCIDTAFYIDRRHTAHDLHWIAWLLEGLGLDDVSRDTGVPGLSRAETYARMVPVPPPAEQRAIAADLGRRAGAIEALAATLDERLDALAALRTGLIREAVQRGVDAAAPLRDSGVAWIGRLPRHWTTRRLKWLAELRTGHTPTRSDPSLWRDCTIPWVSLGDTEAIDGSDYLEITAEAISLAGLDASSAKLLPAGSVLVTRDASVGRATIITRPMACSQHLAAWTCGPELVPEYLLYCLYALRPELERLSMGATIGTIGLPLLASVEIPLPPLDEQATIIRAVRPRVQHIDELVETTRAQRTHLAELRHALVVSTIFGHRRVA